MLSDFAKGPDSLEASRWLANSLFSLIVAILRNKLRWAKLVYSLPGDFPRNGCFLLELISHCVASNMKCPLSCRDSQGKSIIVLVGFPPSFVSGGI